MVQVLVKNEVNLLLKIFKKQSTNLAILKLPMIQRLPWKLEAPVWFSHRNYIDTEFGQSVLAVFYSTARLNTLQSNSRFWVNLRPSWQRAERRFGARCGRCVAKGWVGSACVRAGTRLTCPFPPNCSLSLRCCSVCNWPWFWVLQPPPLLHPELRHVTWRRSWSDWVTSGEEVHKQCCLACSWSSVTPSTLFDDMVGPSDCVKGRLLPGSQLRNHSQCIFFFINQFQRMCCNCSNSVRWPVGNVWSLSSQD